MSILGKKGEIWTKNCSKWAGLGFSWTININFPKEDHTISFYNQSKQNSMYSSEDISQNADFGQKGAILGQKGPKIGVARFFLDCKPQFSKRRS